MDGSICRIERMGDPEARFDAISANGSTAYDMAQSFANDRSPAACLSTSDVVARVEFPRELDLMDVLRICRAIHEGEKTHNYTLQSYNCYFFTLAIQAVLTRLVAGWEEFTPDTWNLCLDEGLSALSHLYKEAPSIQTQPPFILRIYSLLAPEIQWPADPLLPQLKRDLFDLELVKEVNKACTTALWHSGLDLAVDHVLCEKVRDTVGRMLCDQEVGSTSQDLHASSTGNVELAFAESQCGKLMSVLVSRAISRHKNERPTPKLKQLWEHMNLFQAFELFSSAAQSLRNLDFRRTRKPLLTDRPPHLKSSNTQWAFCWLMYAKSLATWALVAVLKLFWVVPLDFMQPRRGVSVEGELEQSLFMLESSKQIGRTTDLTPMLKKLRFLVNTQEPVLWREWPWTHVSELIKRRVTELAFNEEKNTLRVAFQNGDTQTASLFSFQNHLLNRIRLHSQRVESFRLGRAIHIQNDIEDKISQAWVLVRNNDLSIRSNGSSHSLPPYSLSPATTKPGKPPFIFKAFVGNQSPYSQLQEWANYYRIELVWVLTHTNMKGSSEWTHYPVIKGHHYSRYLGQGSTLRDSQNRAAKMIIESGILEEARKRPSRATWATARTKP
ncbi:hypothetical protein FRC08_016062 [Ceratobasidium sp. 394]|nr:hypothetical protein FRC08_016062 [Ceratobasidium sp. 394]KAG9089231.1 hypothetical protein FS749_001503 [Ceratobasidium sp. UAMH 11750]